MSIQAAWALSVQKHFMAYVFSYVFLGASYVFPYVLEGMQQSVLLLLSLVLLKCAPTPLTSNDDVEDDDV